MPPFSRIFTVGLVLAVFSLSGAFASANKVSFAPSANEVELVNLMAKRLDFARHVAWYKFKNKLPIYDAKRQSELIAEVVAEGKKKGLCEPLVKSFFEAQIEASKEVQREFIAVWSKGVEYPKTAPADLNKTLRPALYAVSEEILDCLAKMQPKDFNSSLYAYGKTVLNDRGCSLKVGQIAAAPLK